MTFIGDVYAIPLPDGTYAFGRVLLESSVAFYKHRGENTNDLPPTEDYELSFNNGVLIFSIGVKSYPINEIVNATLNSEIPHLKECMENIVEISRRLEYGTRLSL